MTTITIKEYFARDGSEFSKSDARIIGPVLQALSEQGGVTARDVIDAARSSNSPLHPYFEWNDKAAADEYRLYQARSMLRSIRVRYDDAGGEQREGRAFEIVRKSPYEPEARTYRSFQVLHGDSAFAAQMLGAAFDDLQMWKRKYEPYVGMWKRFGDAFQGVVNQIAEWRDEYFAGEIAGETDNALARLVAWRDESKAALDTWTACREQIEYIMEAIREAEKVFGVVPLAKARPCIRCGKDFKSEHVGHRICPSCAQTQKVSSGVGESAIEFMHGD